MQVSHKEEILKLLNMDSMIKDYLQQPRLNRKTPATNNKPKSNRLFNHQNTDFTIDCTQNSKKITNSTPQKPKKMNTVDVSFSNNRNYSAGNINRRTLQPERNTANRNRSMIKMKVCQQKSLTQKQWTQYTQYQNPRAKFIKAPQSKVCASSKVFKCNDDSYLGILQGNCNAVVYKKKNQNKSTRINDSESEVDNTLQVQQALTNAFNKKRVKLKLPNSQTDSKFIKAGTILKGRYQCQKIIGRGLSGEVYKAKDILSQRFVAIKVIQTSNIEYQFIKQLQHPNMIKYYNSFIENEKRCIVLEYLPHSLAQIVRKNKLGLEQIKKIFKAIASGLMYLHSLSYVHRDIKLDNLVCNQDLSIIKYIDFGLCLDVSQCDAKQMKRFCGTTSYMAPQVISGACREPKKADIWSLGVVLYVLCVGRNPFAARQQYQVLNKIKNNKIVFPQTMSQNLKSLLSSMLDKNPDSRPSIYEVVNNNWHSE